MLISNHDATANVSQQSFSDGKTLDKVVGDASVFQVEAYGFRSQVVPLLGVVRDPTGSSEVGIEKSTNSLSHLLAKPVRYRKAPNNLPGPLTLNSIWSI